MVVAAPTSQPVAARAPPRLLPHGGFRALPESAPASLRFSVGRRRTARLEVKAARNVFGNHFQVATYGESHGGGVGCVISGCPPRIPLTEADMQVELDRRRPGQSRITTPRKETDTCQILSGTHEGMTTGTPIQVFVPNTDQIGGVQDYSEMAKSYRPSHADATYDFKYSVRAVQMQEPYSMEKEGKEDQMIDALSFDRSNMKKSSMNGNVWTIQINSLKRWCAA